MERCESRVWRCTKTACYNQRNGRECWVVMHTDALMSFEWTSEEEATTASKLPRAEAIKENAIRQFSTC